MASNVVDFKAVKRAKRAAQRRQPRGTIAPNHALSYMILNRPAGLTLAQMSRRDAVRQHASEQL